MSLFKNIFSGSKPKHTEFSPGDIFYMESGKKYQLYKLLAVDAAFDCYHVLSYAPLDSLPAVAELPVIPVFIYHSPVDKNGFPNAKLWTNAPVTADDLIGYHEYLRQTQAPKEYIPLANHYYKTGNSLAKEKKYEASIDAYSKAIDLFPQFFEALDNRAFSKMDLGRWGEAIADFSLSLELRPNSLLAEFSIGECYFKMRDYQHAKRQFEIALTIAPGNEHATRYLAMVNDILSEQ